MTHLPSSPGRAVSIIRPVIHLNIIWILGQKVNKINFKFVKYINPFFRILTGLLFIISGVFKLTNVEAFKYTLFSLDFFNTGISNILSYIIPVIEILLGLLLTLGIFTKFSAVHINTMVVIFAIVTYYAVSRNLDLLCGCFGSLRDMKFSWYHLLFLFLIFSLNLIFILFFNDTWSLEKIIKNKLSGTNKEPAIKITIIVVMVLGVILIIIASLFNFTNWGRNIKNNINEKISLVNTTGENKTSMVKTITVDEAYQAYISEESFIFLDVRSPEEYSQGHIKGAILIPATEILARISELPKDKPIIAYCDGSSCSRSGKAAMILTENGFMEVYNMAGGGIFEWLEKNYPFETGD